MVISTRRTLMGCKMLHRISNRTCDPYFFLACSRLAKIGCRALCFPDPLDQRARVHLDALPSAAEAHRLFPRLGETHGYEVDLGPGDVLFIPHHWWHHVETTVGDDGVDGLSLSLNLWFDFEPRLASPVLPLRPGLHVELARHVEAWLGQLLPATQIPSFLANCALELRAATTDDDGAVAAADDANANGLDRQWLVARCLLFAELATSWVGWPGLRPFFDDLLCVERFRGLVAVEREMGGG